MLERIIKKRYKNTVPEAYRGDITETVVEAIVNPANSLLIMGGGVAGAIKRKGGKEIEIEARKYASVPIGQSVATTACSLSAKYIIHAPTMETPAQRTSLDAVSKAMKAALICADEKSAKSVAFPGLGTGVGGIEETKAARLMISETLDHIKGGTRIQRILFVGYGDKLAEAFAKELDTRLPVD